MRPAKTKAEIEATADHGESFCSAHFRPEGPVCTRPWGHKGEHIAACGKLIITKWAQREGVQP